MRIVTWNCCRGPASSKLALLAHLSPDIAVVPECARPAVDDPACLWFGDNPRQGLAITASRSYRITPAESRNSPRFTVPIQVSGPVPFLLLAVWSKTDLHYRYVKAVIRAVELYRDLIVAQPTVIVGDFNSNTIWDFKRVQNHSALVRSLEELGLVSAYHHFYGEAHGAESRPTLHLLRQKAKPYHIDYCFIPNAWLPFLRSVEVGSYDDWHRASDHQPLTIDLALPRTETV